MSDRWAVHHGDCREVMQAMDAESVDSIVSDPPYGLSFMGKGWDHGVPGVEFWEAALRVAKPGCHLLAFGGTRTFHRLTVAIEDAGWDIRDCLMWVYGSGFPKSHDVSKAIDKAGGDALAWRAFSEAYSAAVAASSMTHSDIDRVLGIKSSSCYWARTDHRGGMPPRHHWERVRELLALPSDFAQLYDEAEREVVGEKSSGLSAGSGHTVGRFTDSRNDRGLVDITAPATDAARQWQGWGTALKPAWEPIILARKPLSGTVAANVLQHGTGAINVDGCRVAGVVPKTVHGVSSRQGEVYGKYRDEPQESNPSLLGRWPANLIHDGSDEVVGLFPANAPSGGVTHQPNRSGFSGFRSGRDDGTNIQRAPDSGSAARFFYCAKASKRDRDEGCEANHHPTVKPTDLMRYLCRLVTPPDGLVFDPFTGSGSTGKAAMLEGFRFVGAELSFEYIEIARARIGHAAGKTRQKELALA